MLRVLFICCCSLLAVSLNISANDVYNHRYYDSTTIADLQMTPDAKHFLVIGDWGRNGHFYQRDVARWMDIAAYTLDPEFVATTGDNFYDNGVASVEDPYWQTSFEAIYHGPHLFIDWFPTLGNHDYRGNWQAQIDYSQVSRRWQMLAPYYQKSLTLNQKGTALVLFIDTSPLNPEYANRAKYAATQQPDADAQLHWINTQLAASDADWKIVIGHHPLYSSGKRYGKTSGIREVLEPIFEQHKVDAYFAGHEHDLQHNQPQHTHVAHFVSGGGSEIRKVTQRPFTRFAAATGGFASVSISKATLTVQFIDYQGKVLYSHSIHKGTN